MVNMWRPSTGSGCVGKFSTSCPALTSEQRAWHLVHCGGKMSLTLLLVLSYDIKCLLLYRLLSKKWEIQYYMCWTGHSSNCDNSFCSFQLGGDNTWWSFLFPSLCFQSLSTTSASLVSTCPHVCACVHMHTHAHQIRNLIIDKGLLSLVTQSLPQRPIVVVWIKMTL